MIKNLYEIFDEFKLEKNDEGRIKVLKKYFSKEFCQVMKIVFFTDFKFLVTGYPFNYKSQDSVPGISYSNYVRELEQLKYLVNTPDNPMAYPNNVRKVVSTWAGILQRLEPHEAEVFVNIIQRDLKVPGLTKELVSKAFPGIETWQA